MQKIGVFLSEEKERTGKKKVFHPPQRAGERGEGADANEGRMLSQEKESAVEGGEKRVKR